MKPLTHGDSATRQGLWHGFSLFALLAGGVLAHGASFPVPATGSALAGPTAAEWDHKWNLFKKIGKSNAEIQDKLDRTYAQWLGRTWKGKDPGRRPNVTSSRCPGVPSTCITSRLDRSATCPAMVGSSLSISDDYARYLYTTSLLVCSRRFRTFLPTAP
jgi:hypothetical protein